MKKENTVNLLRRKNTDAVWDLCRCSEGNNSCGPSLSIICWKLAHWQPWDRWRRAQRVPPVVTGSLEERGWKTAEYYWPKARSLQMWLIWTHKHVCPHGQDMKRSSIGTLGTNNSSTCFLLCFTSSHRSPRSFSCSSVTAARPEPEVSVDSWWNVWALRREQRGREVWQDAQQSHSEL